LWALFSLKNSSGSRQVPPAAAIDYNRRVLRRLTAAALVVLVQIGALAAPLTHVHLDAEETEHHHGQALHAHLSGHDSHDAVRPHRPGPIVDHQEEAGRTVDAQIFVSAAADPFSLPAVPPSAFVLVVPAAQPRGRMPHTAHATDPPTLDLGSPRAPPASLS
jgi:hypothetical protein